MNKYRSLTNLRDIEEYNPVVYKKVLDLIEREDQTLHKLISKELLPLKVVGFPVVPRKICYGSAEGVPLYHTSYIVSVRKRVNKKAYNYQIYLGQNRLDLDEIVKKVLQFFKGKHWRVKQELGIVEALKELEERGADAITS